jgi:hypothetical protein
MLWLVQKQNIPIQILSLVNDFSSIAYLGDIYSNYRTKVKRISEAEVVMCSKVLAVHLRQMTHANHEKHRIVDKPSDINPKFVRIQIIRSTVK